jgi:hypothetical protein
VLFGVIVVPAGVGRPIDLDQIERPASSRVCVVQDVDLAVDLRGRDIAVREAGALVDDVDVNIDDAAGRVAPEGAGEGSSFSFDLFPLNCGFVDGATASDPRGRRRRQECYADEQGQKTRDQLSHDSQSLGMTLFVARRHPERAEPTCIAESN